MFVNITMFLSERLTEKCPCLHQVTFLCGDTVREGRGLCMCQLEKKNEELQPSAQLLSCNRSSPIPLFAPRKSVKGKIQPQQLPHLALFLTGKLCLRLTQLMTSLQNICRFSWECGSGEPRQRPAQLTGSCWFSPGPPTIHHLLPSLRACQRVPHSARLLQ